MCYCTDGTIAEVENLERRLRIAEGHIEAGRLLEFYQVGSFFSMAVKVVSFELLMKVISRSINYMVK